MPTHLAVIGTVMSLAVASLSAHDFWLAAEQSGGATTITGHVGATFPVPDSRTTPDRVDIWRVVGATGDLTSAGDFFQDGESLATRVTLTPPGTYLGIMTILPGDIEMTGEEFTDYLREEGLERVIGERERLGQTDQSARERYARYAKIILPAGEGDATHVTSATGTKAELVPSVNPATLSPGRMFSVQLLVEGQPVADALIAAVSRDARLESRTDRDGRARFALPETGAWLIKTVHMARPANTGVPPADWESYWVTLAFEN